MIRPGFLDQESRDDLLDIARDSLTERRLARRANALLLLDAGWSRQRVSDALFIDDDTIRTWHRLYLVDGIDGLAGFGLGGSACRLSVAQQEQLAAWITATLPRTTREIGAWIEREFESAYQGRSGLIKLLHRLGINRRGGIES